jgi:Icc protein
MSKIRILHISDIHLTDQGVSIWGVNTMEHFHKLFERIKTHSNIDAIIISGDLSNDGTRWSYEYADSIFSQLGIPTYICMGNHDNFESLNKYMHYCKNVSELQINDWGILFLNSVIPDTDNPEKNKARGEICAEQLRLINEASSIYKNVILVLHHPPIETRGWLDRRILENRKEFIEYVEACGNIRLVMYGHIHCYTNVEQCGVIYTSAPAVSYAFDNRLAKFEIDYGQEGYNLIEIEEDEISVTNYKLNHNCKY